MWFFWFRYMLLWKFRKRLRCPHCKVYGTYKPFPRIVVNRTFTVPRRFLCKHCGFYENEHGRITTDTQPDAKRKCWTLPEDFEDPKPTPQEILKDREVNPWAG